MSSGKVLASVLAGAAAGAILGILFAPDKGTETRRKIAEKGTGLADTVRNTVSEYSDVISEKYDSVREKLTGSGSGSASGSAGDARENQGKGSMKSDVRNAMNS